MTFYSEKCQVINICRRRNVYHHNYILHGHSLAHVNSAKYLGITIAQDLNWNKHINNIAFKANNTLPFLSRNLQINNSSLKATAYHTLVRPQLEYACSVWDPYIKTNIDRLEMIQRRAARYTLNQYNNTSSVTDMLQTLHWPTLEGRWKTQRLHMVYKIRHGLVILDNEDERLKPSTRSTRTSHDQSYDVPYSRANYHRYSFKQRPVRDWNTLPAQVVAAPSLTQFKESL